MPVDTLTRTERVFTTVTSLGTRSCWWPIKNFVMLGTLDRLLASTQIKSPGQHLVFSTFKHPAQHAGQLESSGPPAGPQDDTGYGKCNGNCCRSVARRSDMGSHGAHANGPNNHHTLNGVIQQSNNNANKQPVQYANPHVGSQCTEIAHIPGSYSGRWVPGPGNYGHYLPDVDQLRANQQMSDSVSQRMVDLGLYEDGADNSSDSADRRKGKKSGLSRTVEDRVLREIDWPHFYIYRGQDRRSPHFGELTLAEFLFGFLSMVNNPRNNLNKELMLSILKDMMLDATQFGWPQIRNYYSILASGIEMARYDWSDGSQVSALRAQYAQRPNFSNQSRQSGRSGSQNGSVKLCNAYQMDDCSHPDGHDGYLHACAFCYNSTGMLYRHKEKDCRRKSAQSKNGQRGGA